MNLRCLKCGFVSDNNDWRCPLCGARPRTRLVLAVEGDRGKSWNTPIAAEVTRTILKKLYPELRIPVDVRGGLFGLTVGNQSNVWFLTPNPSGPLELSVNGSPCNLEMPCLLNVGDSIGLAFRDPSHGVPFAPLKVSFELMQETISQRR